MKRSVTRTLIMLLTFWLISLPKMSGGEPVGAMLEERAVPACDEEWICQLMVFLDTYSSPSSAILLEQASHERTSTAFLLQTLDSLPALGKKGQEILSSAMTSKTAAIRNRAAQLLRKPSADVEP